MPASKKPRSRSRSRSRSRKKSSSPRKRSKSPTTVRPKTVDLVVSAIRKRKDRKGCSAQAIRSYIKLTYRVAPRSLNTMVRRAILSGLKTGVVVRAKGDKSTGAKGRFRAGRPKLFRKQPAKRAKKAKTARKKRSKSTTKKGRKSPAKRRKVIRRSPKKAKSRKK